MKLWWSQDNHCKLIHNILSIKKEKKSAWYDRAETLHSYFSCGTEGPQSNTTQHSQPHVSPGGPYWPPWGT